MKRIIYLTILSVVTARALPASAPTEMQPAVVQSPSLPAPALQPIHFPALRESGHSWVNGQDPQTPEAGFDNHNTLTHWHGWHLSSVPKCAPLGRRGSQG